MGFGTKSAGAVTVMCIIPRLLPGSQTGTIRSGWHSRAGLVNRRSNSAARIALSENAGDDDSTRLQRQSSGFAIVDFVRLTWRHQQPSSVRREVGRDQPPPRESQVIGQACHSVEYRDVRPFVFHQIGHGLD